MFTRLYQLRTERNWTRPHLAAMLNISVQMVYYLETGLRKPSYEVLCKLEDLFQLSHRELFAPADFEAKCKVVSD